VRILARIHGKNEITDIDNKIKHDMKQAKILTLIFALAATGAQAQRITAVHEVIDCGSVLYESPATAKFELRNKGNDLVINDVRTNCGCVVTSYPKGIIAKGDSFAIQVVYDARQLGHFEKEVAIYSNASELPFYLKMRGVVVDKLVDFTGKYDYTLGTVRTDKNNIEFDDVNMGDRPVQKIHIINSGSSSVSPVVMHLPSWLTASVSPTTIAPGRAGIATLTLNSEKLRDYGLTQTSVYLGMFHGDKVNDDKEIIVSAVLLPDFRNMSESQRLNAPVLSLSERSLELGEFGEKQQKSGTITITNTGKSRLEINSLQMFTMGLKVRLNKTRIAPGETAKLKITAYKKQLKNARSLPRVLMITNDPKNAKVTINVNVK